MDKKYLYKLEYNKVLDILSKYAKTYIGKDMCFTLMPSSNKEEVNSLLLQTNEAIRLYNIKGSIPIYPFLDISIWVKNLESYVSLSTKALLEVGRILKMSRQLKEYFASIDDITEYSSLEHLFSNIYTNPNIENNIFKSIIDENNISDNASGNLSSIRRKRKSLEQNIKTKLNSFIHSSSNSKYIQEPIVTIKNDRFVVPIKGEYRSMVKGFIHDISSSGATVFVEPLSIFEINNEINALKLEENIEIEKILLELSKSLFPFVNELNNNIDIISKLDFIFAKAMYSIDLDGICPILNDDNHINLVKARHPLIDKALVVPIDLSIGKDFQTLVITGPNTGGKTVTLKTVGLLTLMALSGLNIPADENSSIFVFDNIFADIGDDQNITESLSTFSSHILNIIQITKKATSNSLILLDELGSGTDPEEGSGLAISVLEYFKNINAITIATTHYPNIKNYAILTDGFENASCEFDIQNLKPTYKLLMGIPGKSNAFEISKKLGLDDSILNKAKSFINKDSVSIEELLKTIYDDKVTIEYEKEQILKNSNQIKVLRKKLEEENTNLNLKKKQILEDAKLEARDILLDAKDKSSKIIRQMNSIKKNMNSDSIKDLNNLRNEFNESIKKLNTKSKEKIIIDNLKSQEIKIGMNVFVNSLGQVGTILSLPNKSNEVQVQLGNVKMNVLLTNLSKTNINTTSDTPTNTKSFSNSKAKTVSAEINVIGNTVEEAIYVLDKYLDDSSISNLPSIRIIHGKGTGALKNGIHAFLKKHPHVKSYRLGTFGEGEMGVTVVELK